ncbi:hypothetical protein T07_8091 [Trichinella nelsoni]|uniref:Uncharacterized protein n=1 Tax=Trichinella nelsoni TaxID=6336 RepID=A0A0V0SMH8_9BILA|nr:hypothetical protein T07_8091 [Trichinella nelsoni]
MTELSSDLRLLPCDNRERTHCAAKDYILQTVNPVDHSQNIVHLTNFDSIEKKIIFLILIQISTEMNKSEMKSRQQLINDAVSGWLLVSLKNKKYRYFGKDVYVKQKIGKNELKKGEFSSFIIKTLCTEHKARATSTEIGVSN